jgi:POT family proton-dependent oligopeptide transporter
LGNLIAGLFAGEFREDAVDQMPALFLRIVLTTVGTGVVLLILVRPIKKLMGNVR